MLWRLFQFVVFILFLLPFINDGPKDIPLGVAVIGAYSVAYTVTAAPLALIDWIRRTRAAARRDSGS